jgi:hypothetical protein
MQIISASRRTDIPAFHSEWFMRRIREGWVEYRNPFGGATHRVSLLPQDVRAIVFWTRASSPMHPHLDELDAMSYHYYFHFTITGLPRGLEPCSPPKDHAVAELRSLSDRIGAKRVLWRFDPILESDRSPLSEQRDQFARLARDLSGHTERCYISFADFYGKAARRLSQAGVAWRNPPDDVRRAYAMELAEIAAEHSIHMYACCEDGTVGGTIAKAHCVDADLIEELWPMDGERVAIRPTRKGCGCHASRDIGAYDTCGHSCLYCYASTARSSAQCYPDAARLMRLDG